MNISSGISQISFAVRMPGNANINKIFIWPEYSRGRIDKIRAIKENNPEINYIKPGSGKLNEKDLSQIQSFDINYSSKGLIQNRTNGFLPGTLLDIFI